MKCTYQSKPAVADDSGDRSVHAFGQWGTLQCVALEIVLPIPDHLALPDKMVPLLLEPPSATPLSVEGGHRNMMWISIIVHGFSSS